MLVGATNGGAAGNFGIVTASMLTEAAGGREGGRGGEGRLRLPGGAESGRPRVGGGGGKLRTGVPSEAFGDDGGVGAALAPGVAALDGFDGPAAVGDDPGFVSRGRGGTEGGTDARPETGRGGEGFLD